MFRCSTVLTIMCVLVYHACTVSVSAEVSLQKHASDEFVKYVGKMTGTEPTVAPAGVCTLKQGKVQVAIGRNAVTDSLLKKGLVQIPKDLGEEGFVIRSVEDGGTKYLVLSGGSPKGTLYAVYHYLEKFCRVGFFADGERIPKLDEIPVEGIDIIERPRWPMRQYMMDCEYISYWWGWDEWKREVDWAAKHKFNVLSSNFDFTATWRKVWKRFGVDVPPTSLTGPPFHPWARWHNWAMKPPYPEDFQDFQAELAERFTKYGRSLGMKMAPDFVGFIGQVPKEFHEAYRDRASFFKVGWMGFSGATFIHPDDPLYAKVAKAYAEEYLKRFGTDHLWASHTFCEMRPGKNDEETLAIETACAKKNLQAIRSVDPKAVLFTTTWTFLSRTKENVNAYLEALPDDAYQAWDMCGDARPGGPPLYKKLDYYFGKPWLFTFLYAYGGTTMLHGNLADLIQRAQDVAADPKADKCLGLGIEPEAICHNYMAFDLISRLAWNPAAVKLEAFLEDYAERRYGKASAAKMVECFKELVDSVYGVPFPACPLYMVRINNKHLRPGNPYGVSQSKSFLPHLQKALELALEESDRLGDSPLYQHDLIDIARQYLSDLFDLHVARLTRACRAEDKEAFEREARLLDEILTSQEMLLSSSDYFCLAPILAKARALPGAPEDFEEHIRDILTVWAGKIIDYAHRDYYELVRFYYRPRVEAFIEHCRGRLGRQAAMVNDKELASIYHQIEQAWVKKPFKVAKSEKYAGTPVEAVAEVLKKHRLSEEEFAKLPTETFVVSLKPLKPGEYSKLNEQGYRIAASGSINNTRPEMAIDGNLNTAWWGEPCPQWCQIDLGTVGKVSELNIVFYYRDNRYYQYRVEASQDEKQWQTIADETKNTDLSAEEGKTHTLKPSMVARYLRLTVTHNSANPTAHVQEIRVKVEGKR